MRNATSGYKWAAAMDVRINTLLEQFPLTDKRNHPGWRIFCQTIRTGMNVIESAIEREEEKG